MPINTLYDYYTSQGQALPSVGDRTALATSAGISGYTGTAAQNATLLSYLQSNPSLSTSATSLTTPTSPVNVPTPGQSPVPNINAATSPSIPTTTSGAGKTDLQKSLESLVAPVQEYADPTQYNQSVQDYQTLVNQESNKSADQLAAEQAAGVNEATQTVNDLSSQLTALNNEATAQKISVENQPIVGSIVAGQQDAIDRSRAVRALTISSALSAAQGKLGLAQAQADKAIAAKYGPIEAKLKYQQDFINLNYQNLTREDKKKADEFQVKLTNYQNAIAAQKQTTKDINDVLMTAAKNKADAQTLNNIQNAGSVTQAITAAGRFLGGSDIDALLKQAQLDQAHKDIIYKQAEIDKILSETAANDPRAIQAQKQSETLNTLSLVDSIINDPYLTDVVGLKSPGAAFGGFFGRMFGSPTVKVQNEINQLQGLLSLENRQKLKGSGAISDFEARTLSQAASSFSTGLSNEDAKAELIKIRGVMASASGLPTTVKITDPKTGQSQTVSATRDGINQAIIDGLTVEYQ